MAVDPNRKKVTTAYISDDGNVYNKVQQFNHAAANSSTAGADYPGFPRGWTPRCVHGRSEDGTQKCTLIVPDPTNPLFLDPNAPILIPGLGIFQKTGSTGEKRPNGAPMYS